MLLKRNLSLYRVLKLTWQVDIAMLLVCSVAYFIDVKLFPHRQIPYHIPALLGTAMAFFVAFNNNQAYDRWWEARIIWGAIVNDSRTWARNLLAYNSNTDLSRKMIIRHLGFLYALKAALRSSNDQTYKRFLSADEAEFIGKFKNIPNAILDLQAQSLHTLELDGFHFLSLDDTLKNFCDGMGKSERIKNTVFPTLYIYFTRLFIWILVTMITVTSSASLGELSILLGWLIGFVFHATHINGMIIMNPFELDPACIPLNSIVRTIEINLLQALGEASIPEPEPTVHEGEYIL